jgi:RHS repeat-associated protein
MTKDDNKGISTISYNHLNLPTKVTIAGKNIDYKYDATGAKLSKTVSGITTYYAGNFIYENDNLQFFNQPEGYVTPNGSNGFDYIYQYKDHLGNVRLSYTENTEPSRIETIFNDGFIDTMGGWVANGSTNPSLVNGRVRVNVNSPWEGLRNQLEDLEVTPGDKYTVQVKFDKGNTQSNIRFYIQEFDANGSHLRWIGLSWNLQTGQYNYNYTVGANAKKIYLRIDKSNTNTSSQTQFYLDNVTLIKGEAQTVFTDGFDSMANWDRSQNSFGHPISALDSSKKRSGAYSGRIDDNYPTNGEKYVYSDTWTSINNSNDTFYTVSAWVYIENVSDNSAEIFLTTRKSGETGYPSGHYVSDKITQKEQWVYVEKSISVPANVRQLNVRVDNNKDGKVWFDDVKILKGNAAQTLIVEESNYYPFGLEHKGYNNVINGAENNFHTYNGKEHEKSLGLNWHDYGARRYDASIGRWMSTDPYAEKYETLSPYTYVANNPVNAIDPDGRLIIYVNGLLFDEALAHKSSGILGKGGFSSHYAYPPPRNFQRNGISMFGNQVDYWGGDNGTRSIINNHFNDNNNLFVNATDEFGSQASDRFAQGQVSGLELIAKLQNGTIELENEETIKVVGHSQGAAFAAGMLTALANSEYASRVELGLYLSPHQPGGFEHPDGIPGAQLSTRSDWVSSKPKTLLGRLMQAFNGQSELAEIQGVDFLFIRPNHDGGKGGHNVDTWNAILQRISDFLNDDDDE